MTSRSLVSQGKSASMLLPIAMFAVATFFYLYEFLLRVSPNVLEEQLILDFKMNAQSFGFFSSCYFWSYAALQLPVGALTDKYGPRRLLSGAIWVCGLSTLAMGYTQNFWVGCLARFFIGAGSAFAFISCLKIVTLWFPSRLFPLLTGLTVTIGTLGAAAGGSTLSLALDIIAWRPLMIWIGIVGILLSFCAWFLIKDHNPDHPSVSMRAHDTPGFLRCLKEVVCLPQSWILGIYAFFVTAPTDAFGGTWGVKFLVEVHHFSRDAASFSAVTMTFVGMAIGSPVIGWISSYFNNRKASMMIAALIASVTLTYVIYAPHLTPMTAALSFFIFGASGTFVLAFVMARRIAASMYVATAIGFLNMLSMFGSALLTYFIGWSLERMRSGTVGESLYSVADYHASLLVLPLFYAISALVLVPFIRDSKEV